MSIPEGCKPFDLERALAGDPVVTRDGRPVAQLVKFDVDDDVDAVYGVVNNGVGSWSIGGRYWSDGESDFDLFMAPKKRVVWVNLYPDGDGYWYDSEESAESGHDDDRIGNRAWPVEIED